MLRYTPSFPFLSQIFTVETLDGVAELASYYDMDENGQAIAAKVKEGPSSVPTCPTCRSSLFSVR